MKEKRDDMLAEERFAEIIGLVNEQKTVTVQELTERLNTSESTIRRDLTTLHKKGSIIKVHGGATAVNMGGITRDASVSVRQDMNMEEKISIGRYAATLVEDDDFVFIDAGTSTDMMIDYLTEKNAVYVTNAIGHAQKLLKKGLKVFLLGGELKETTEAIVGAEAIESLKKYNFTKGFFGSNGVHKNSGFTTPDITEALVKEKAMKQCKEKYVLVDSSKIGQISAVTFAAFDEGTILTTSLKDKFYRNCKNIMEVK